MFNLRTIYIVESINVSFDDGKMTGFNGENHERLEFENDKITLDGSSNPNKSNADEVSPDDDINAHFQGEHMQNDVISDLLSSSTEDSDERAYTDESSNFVDTSNADEITQSAGSIENNVENTISGGALEETQENSLEDLTDAGGTSSSRQQLPPARKWTKDHTPELIIDNPEAGVQTRSATQNECLFHKFRFRRNPNFKFKSNVNRFQRGGSSTSNSSRGGYRTGMVDRSKIRCFNCNEMGHFATECKKPRQFKNTSYDVSQKKKSGKAYLAEGKSWDDSESEDEEVGNLALMAISDNPSSSKP